MDSINNDLQNELSAWPFRYYVIESNLSNTSNTSNTLNISREVGITNQIQTFYKFKFIPDPSDAEFNLEELFKQILPTTLTD